MADAEKKTLGTIGKLYAKLRELQAAEYEITEEIGKLLAGGPGTAAMLKRLEGTFERAWEVRYKGRYLWAYAKDRPQLKRLLARFEAAEIESRMQTYISDGDEFYVKTRHSFGLFVISFNRLASFSTANTLAELVEPPADCKHAPRCTSDQEHTRKRTAELRH